MITLLLICYFFNGLMVSTIHGAINFNSGTIMCGYDGTGGHFEKLPPYEIPPECDVIILTSVFVHPGPMITCNEDDLKPLVANHPVILVISRNYDGWVEALQPEGIAAEATAIIDYATAKGCAGVLLEGTSPPSSPTDTSIGENLKAYITSLKSKAGFYVGITIGQNYPNALADPKALNYEDFNKLVDSYLVNTYRLHEECKADIFNGFTPITGIKDYVGMDSVLATLQNTTILVDKSYLVEELLVIEPTNKLKESNVNRAYGNVCDLKENIKTWCAPTTKDYYEKGKFIKDSKYGLCVKYVEYDDILNNCSCGPFIGFQNILAGYLGQLRLPCDQFDRKNPVA